MKIYKKLIVVLESFPFNNIVDDCRSDAIGIVRTVDRAEQPSGSLQVTCQR